ncbi:hypothetical protein FHS18_003749 [Paenibacillus phyllosphaerae]|uniref:Uncharacterized protein n=1 Tax=Paenibacillus phyllosphaerae TaxID=274593 RepID=A0A7W5B0Y5_9BACL|nr:hypothetical protein [Paenibacillus phyllosphaerae]MBB3111681.1 hypothetical protein [Paenibacillus phyllosphaerae]
MIKKLVLFRSRISLISYTMLLFILVLQGCGVKPDLVTDPLTDFEGNSQLSSQAAASEDSHVRASIVSGADVRWVHMSWPIPMDKVSQPLIGSRDGNKINELLGWVDQARRIEPRGLTSPLDGRSMAINIDYANGERLQIRPAWTCTSSQDEQGNTETSCNSVEDRIWVSNSKEGEYFAESASLYDFIQQDYLDWMPSVAPYEAPDQLKAGDEYLIRGHGALADWATVELIEDNDTVLLQKIPVKDGEWQAKGTLPDNLPEGDYEWQIDTGETTYGVAVHISHK